MQDTGSAGSADLAFGQYQLLWVEIIDINHLASRHFCLAQGLGFKRLQDASLQGGINGRLSDSGFDLATFQCRIEFFL